MPRPSIPPVPRILWPAIVLVAAIGDGRSQSLVTRWAKTVTPANVHQEYPRPQMVRKNWTNLNGQWDLLIPGPHPAARYNGKILVPFPVESHLSGVKLALQPGEMLVYSKQFVAPKGERVLLHFGASDWETTVRVNNKVVGQHVGGYEPFTFDITGELVRGGASSSSTNLLMVTVKDPTDTGPQGRGKQVLKPGGIFYTPTSGIWQTVWLEGVPKVSIEKLRIDASYLKREVGIDSVLHGSGLGHTVSARVLDGKKVVASGRAPVGTDLVIKLQTVKPWSPTSPKLYDLAVDLIDPRGKKVDSVTSYCGFRDVSLVKATSGQPRIHLNGKPLFMVGPLDQGFWPDGLYTAPSDEALKYDLEVTKRLGFNMVRKHVKVEPDRFYYWCDKMGLVVFQDIPSGDRFIGPRDPDIEREQRSDTLFRLEMSGIVDALRSHPSIVGWVLFNEGWGQFKTPEMTGVLKRLDPTRLVDSASGWTDRGTGDLNDVHIYPGPGAPGADQARALFLGEFGGLGLVVPGHTWAKDGWGYQSFQTQEELTAAWVDAFRDLRFLIDRPGLSGAVYTQTTDVETELNGLMTYDRELLKIDEARARRAVLDLFKPAPRLHEVVPTSEISPAIWRYATSLQPGTGWEQPGYDDDKWASGPGGFGQKGTPGSIVRTGWASSDIWLRRRFMLPQGYAANELLLRLHHDDDVEVYLDGRLVLKRNGWTTSYRLFDLPASLGTLTAGEHLLAIHCHQNQGGQYIDAGLSQLVSLRPR